MNRILCALAAFLTLSATASAQGQIQMVSTYTCVVPAAATEPDELDSLVTRYEVDRGDTSMIRTLRYDRATGNLLQEQVALSDNYLKTVGYTGQQRPYFYQFRYDDEGRLVYHSNALTGRYEVIDYTTEKAIVKSFDREHRLLDQQVRTPQAVMAFNKKGSR